MDGGSLPAGHIVKIQERSEFIAAPVHGITVLSVVSDAILEIHVKPKRNQRKMRYIIIFIIIKQIRKVAKCKWD